MTFKKGKIPDGATPFKQGETGNPNGRPKGSRNRATIAKKWLDITTKWENPLSGKIESLTLEDQITLAQIKAARDDMHTPAYKALMDTTYGNTRQEVDLIGEIKITDHRLTIQIVEPEDDGD